MTVNYFTTSGSGLQPEEPLLVGFQPPEEVIYIDRERNFMIFIPRDNPSTVCNH